VEDDGTHHGQDAAAWKCSCRAELCRAAGVVRPVFVRLVVVPTARNPLGRAPGVFQAAYRLLRRGALAADEHQHLREQLDWFNDNLARPERFVRTRSKGYYRRQPVALSWFRQEAAEHITRARRVARIVASHSSQVQALHTMHPGYVVYEDEYQVVAIPFRDRFAEGGSDEQWSSVPVVDE
jgi:hypothetical protein